MSVSLLPAARLPLASLALGMVVLAAMTAGGASTTTLAIAAASVVMFAACWANAARLLGSVNALRFVVIAVGAGWFAEQMGSTHGWFFGEYRYTDVLGPRVGDVPFVIPLMWFALTYIGFVMANLIVWHAPLDGAQGMGPAVLLSFLAAMIVTAFDLGADPYFVFVLKAWIMVKTDGAWFGETVQGFLGWMFVAFVIVAVFRLWARGPAGRTAGAFTARHALLPLGMYASGMVFQMIYGHPVEIRSIAPFAMGIPLVCAWAGLQRWRATGGAAA